MALLTSPLPDPPAPPLAAQGAQVAVANQLAPLLVPEPKRERLEAGEESDWLHGLEQRFSPMTLLEVVIGDARAEVMDVMEADIAREPLQHLGQFVKRTALQRR